MKIKAGILGSSGYTGAELLRLIVYHSTVDLRWITSEKFAGSHISSVFPNLKSFLDLKCYSIKDLDKLEDVEIVFSCLPHTTSMQFTKIFLDKGMKIIDLSADFRFDNLNTYSDIYRVKHISHELCRKSAYGLPELFRNQIKSAQLVANPGCFATSAILGIIPLLHRNMITGIISVDSKTGLSGRGRAPSMTNQFSETNESIMLNSITGHSQKFEIEEKLQKIFRKRINIIFSSYEVNTSRGILTTITSRLKNKTSKSDLLDTFKHFYNDEPFVRIYDNEGFISTKNVRYTNYCDIGLNIQDNHVICATALDNLGKGASAQAIQNMNIMFGLDETAHLMNISIYP